MPAIRLMAFHHCKGLMFFRLPILYAKYLLRSYLCSRVGFIRVLVAFFVLLVEG